MDGTHHIQLGTRKDRCYCETTCLTLDKPGCRVHSSQEQGWCQALLTMMQRALLSSFPQCWLKGTFKVFTCVLSIAASVGGVNPVWWLPVFTVQFSNRLNCILVSLSLYHSDQSQIQVSSERLLLLSIQSWKQSLQLFTSFTFEFVYYLFLKKWKNSFHILLSNFEPGLTQRKNIQEKPH